MKYVGIDVHKKMCQAAVLDDEGELLNEYDSLLLLSEALGVTVSDEGEIYKDIIDQHPEYADYSHGEEVVMEDGTRVNPRLHIAIEAAVQWQMANDEPREVNEAYLVLLGEGVDPHEARHAIGHILAEMIWLIQRDRPPQPRTHYTARLRELGRQGLKHSMFTR